MTKLLITRFPLESAWGGEEEIHLLLAQKMRQKGHQIALLTSCPHLAQAFRQAKFDTWKLPYFPDPVSKLSLLVFPLTVIYFFFLGLFYLIYFRCKGYERVLFLRLAEKVIWTPLALLLGYRRIFWGEHAPLGKWLWQNPLLIFYRWWSRKATIITPAEDMARQLRRVVPQAQIEVLPNALSPEQDLSTLKHSPAGLKKILGKKYRSGVYVAYVGRLSREKGLFDFLVLAAKNPQVNFLLVGTGVLKNKLQKKASKNVVFTGFLNRSQLKQLYAGIDIFCLPSPKEPFGIVLLEAMSAGVPIIARPSGAVPEIVEHQKTGFLSHDLQKYLPRLVNDSKLRTTIGREARRVFQKKFGGEVFANRAAKIFFN